MGTAGKGPRDVHQTSDLCPGIVRHGQGLVPSRDLLWFEGERTRERETRLRAQLKTGCDHKKYATPGRSSPDLPKAYTSSHLHATHQRITSTACLFSIPSYSASFTLGSTQALDSHIRGNDVFFNAASELLIPAKPVLVQTRSGYPVLWYSDWLSRYKMSSFQDSHM